MNNDPFTTAARTEAEKRHQGDWDPFEQEPVDDWGFAEAERRAFVTGAEWARTHLAAQEPNRDEVLAAAWAICRLQDDGYEPTEDHPCGACTEFARAALSAACAARRDEERR